MKTPSRRTFLSHGAGAAGFLTLAGAGCLAARQTAVAAGDRPPLDSESFRRAVEAGDLAAVHRYLERDPALIYSRDAEGRSVLILAYLAGQEEIGQLFVERGLSLDLVEAAVVGDWDRVRELGEVAPGTANAHHPIGGSALWAAARFGRHERMWILQGFGADANLSTLGEAGLTPLRAAFEGADEKRVEATVVNLLGNGGDPNASQRDGDSVLHAAARAGNDYLVRVVLRKGGDATARNAAGRTPLDAALAAGNSAAAAVLRHPERVPRDHSTSRFVYDASGGAYAPRPIDGLCRSRINEMVGASHFDLERVRELVSGHPELVHAVSTIDEAAVEACAHTGRKPVVEFLLDRGAPLSLPTALTLGRVDRARKLLQEEPDRIRERGPHDFFLGWYPAIAGGDLDAAQLLLDFGLDLRGEGKLGQTALHWAARGGQEDLCAFWLEAGAEVNARTRDSGLSPLDFALQREQEGTARLLRQRGGRSFAT